jgi:hypothetical protein
MRSLHRWYVRTFIRDLSYRIARLEHFEGES